MTRRRSNSHLNATSQHSSLSVSLAKKKIQQKQEYEDDMQSYSSFKRDDEDESTSNTPRKLRARSYSFSQPEPPTTKFRKKIELDEETTSERRKQRLEALSHGQNHAAGSGNDYLLSGNARILNGDGLPVDATSEGDISSHWEEESSLNPGSIFAFMNGTSDSLAGQIIAESPDILEEGGMNEEMQSLANDLSQWVTRVQNSTLTVTNDEAEFMENEAFPPTDFHPDIFSHRAHISPIQTQLRSLSLEHTLTPRTPRDELESELQKSLTGITSKDSARARRQSTSADILKPQVMTLSHGDHYDDSDPTNILGKSMKKAWDALQDFDDILNNDILSTIVDLSDLIDDFMASNLLNFSLKLRNLFYRIEEVDDINARRTHEERRFMLRLLDIGDEEEKYRARKFLDSHSEDDPTLSSLTPEDIAHRALQRKIRRERSVWNKEDNIVKERESNQLHKETMTNVDSSFIDHLQKEIVNLQRENYRRIQIMEDFCARSLVETKNAVIEVRREYEEQERAPKDEREFGVQCELELQAPAERVIVKETDNSLKSFTKNLEHMFNSLGSVDMPPQMKEQVKMLMHLLINENQMQQDLKDLEKEAKRSKKAGGKAAGKTSGRSSGREGGSGGKAERSDKDAYSDGESDREEEGFSPSESSKRFQQRTNGTGNSSDSTPNQTLEPSFDAHDESSQNATTASVKDYTIEKIGASSGMDVNILRRVKSGASFPMQPNQGPLAKMMAREEVNIEKSTKSPRKRHSTASSGSQNSSKMISIDQIQERHHDSDSLMFPSAPHLKRTVVREFSLSDAPEKWMRRREEIIRKRYENLKKILKCFCTIVFVGNMNGFFKSLWEDDDYYEPLLFSPRNDRSSHHFPEYTGRSGFEELMNSSVRSSLPPQPPQPLQQRHYDSTLPSSNNEFLPHLDESFSKSRSLLKTPLSNLGQQGPTALRRGSIANTSSVSSPIGVGHSQKRRSSVASPSFNVYNLAPASTTPPTNNPGVLVKPSIANESQRLTRFSRS